MGAWDIGIFDDDSSLDLLSDLFEENDLVGFFKNTISETEGADYIEYEDGIAISVCAAVLDAIKNQTMYSHYFDVESEKEGDEQFSDWINSIPSNEKTILLQYCNDIKKALHMLISEQSELCELWEENEESFSKWKQQYLDIISRL